MRLRALGSQGLTVSELGLGCMGMSDFYGPTDASEAEATLLRAVALGVTLFDTADMYGPHTNEILVGRVLKDCRDRITIATKFGIVRDPQNPSNRGICGRPDYVRTACEGSLKRLGVDHIDLYYQHRVDPNVAIEETVGAMGDLVKAGKVRFLGLSEASPETIRRAHRVHPISALQSEYSLWTRDVEPEILPTLRELGIGLVPYSPMGRGFLAGVIRTPDQLDAADFRRANPRFQGTHLDHNLELVTHLENLAQAKNVTAAQLALAWLLHQGSDLVPIPGTRRRTYLEQNLAAADLRLTVEDLAYLGRIFAPGAAEGERYTAEGMKTLDH